MVSDKTSKRIAVGSLRIGKKPGELRIYTDWWQQQSAAENTKTVVFAVITLFIGTTVALGIVPRILSGTMRPLTIGFAIALITVFLILGIWTLYTFVATIVNQTQVTFTRKKIAVTTNPIPFPNSNYEQPLAAIQNIAITNAPTRKRGKSGYTVSAIDHSNTSHLLFTFYDAPEIADRIEQHLTDFLNNKKHITVIIQHNSTNIE